jgi:HAD superfamily hydrolase (TIGR01509 family)
MVKAVLLDAGGVLLDESNMEQRMAELVVQTIRSVAPEYVVDRYWQDVQEAVNRFAPKIYASVIWKHCAGDRALFDRLHHDLRARQREAEIPLALMLGIDKELIALHERYALILAGQYGAPIYELLDQVGVSELFVNRLSQDDFPITKPDPRYLVMLAESAGFLPEECIMVGDRLDNDIIPAKQSGMGTVLVRTGIHRDQVARIPQECPDIDQSSTCGLANAIVSHWG